MALTITTLNLLNRYINGVMERADHHAANVNEVVLALAGAVIWKATNDIEVRTHAGETANILWLTVGNNRYALAYNHSTFNIELRERSIQGNVRAVFNNATPINQIKQIFDSL